MAKEKVKAFIVDDSDFSRKEISKYLERNNIDVVGEASSAKEATQILTERKVDVAIVDIVMPEISGIELTDYITDNFKNTAVIVISSLAQENIVLEAISAGASDYIQKPVKEELLIQSIEKIVQSTSEYP